MAKHKVHLGLGIILSITFVVVLILFFSPVFPEAPDGSPQNGFDFSDRMFNRLSKGSSYFIPKLETGVEGFMGTEYAGTIDMKTRENAEKTAKLFSSAGTTVDMQGSVLQVRGSLGQTLEAVLTDADAMYHNNGQKLATVYGYDEKAVLKNWHMALGQLDKSFKRENMIKEANMVSDVMKKAVETAYNFYGTKPEKVIDRIGLMTGLLAFYVVYTMWWGYAIYFIFEGIGLSMKKAKIKKEV